MDIGGSQKKAEARKRNSVFDADAKFGSPLKRLKCTDDGKKHPVEIEAEDNCDTPILKLPDELFIKIMEMVPIAQWASLERVSRRFQAVMHGVWARTHEIRLDEFLYKEEKLEKDSSQVLNSVLRKLFRRAPNVASISKFSDFSGEYKSIRKASIPALAIFQHLLKIDLSGGQISADNFALLLETSASRTCFKYLNVASAARKVCNW